MKLHNDINYVELYLTLRCNFNCDYCINKHDDNLKRKRKEFPTQSLIAQLNKIDFGDVPLTLGGGEPSIHKDFYEIINGIKDETKLNLLTNLSFDEDVFIKNINPIKFQHSDNESYKSIRVSYHPNYSNTDDIIRKAKKLQDAGFSIGIFGPDHPYNVGENMLMEEKTRKNNLFFYVKAFLGEVDGQLYGHYKYPKGLTGLTNKPVQCRSKELLIGPEGNFYKCHRDLYKQDSPITNISQGVIPNPLFRVCDSFGDCNPCDLKLKTNYFLGGVECQVEIKDL